MAVPKSIQKISKEISNKRTQMPARDGMRVLRFDEFCLNETERLLIRHNSRVHLTGKELDVLLVLIKNRPRLVRKSQLMDELWPDVSVDEANLGVQVANLRKALGENSSNRKYIETVPKHGYRFVGDVREVDGIGAIEALITNRHTDPRSDPSNRRANGDQSPRGLPITEEGAVDDDLMLFGGLRILVRRMASKTEVMVQVPNRNRTQAHNSGHPLQHKSPGVEIWVFSQVAVDCVKLLFDVMTDT